jgi:hypothetical protein
MVNAHINNLKPSSGGNYIGNCPHPDHDDRHPSFSVHELDRVFNCFACGFKGDAVDFAKQFNYDPKPYYRKQGFATSKTGSKSKNIAGNNKKISENNRDKPSRNKKVSQKANYDRKTEAIKRYDLVPFLREKVSYKWTEEAISQLHWSRKYQGIAFPYIDKAGKWRDVYLHKPRIGNSQRLGGLGNVIYPMHLISHYKSGRVFLLEGEKEVVTMLSHGFDACTFTNGANAVPDNLTPFNHIPEMVICYDNDEDGVRGQEKSAKAIKEDKPPRKVFTTDWRKLSHELEDHCDITDRPDLIGELYNTRTFYTRGIQMTELDPFLKEKMKSLKPIVDLVVYERGITLIAGSTGIGKSFLLNQLGLCITTGVPFMGEFEVKQQNSVCYFQFENEDEEQQDRMNMQKAYFEDYPRLDFYHSRKPSTGEVFVDKWKIMETTLEDYAWKEGCLLIDNIYTSTDKVLQENKDVVALLRKVHHLKDKFHCSVVLVGHFNKNWENQAMKSGIDLNMVQGGACLTNNFNNIMLTARSQRGATKRVGKLFKLRSQGSELEDVPFRFNHNLDTMLFEKGGILKNEYMEYIQLDERQEVEALLLFKDNCTPHAGYPNMDVITTDDYREKMDEVTDYKLSSRAEFYWIKRLRDWGLIKKLSKALYQISWERVDDYTQG